MTINNGDDSGEFLSKELLGRTLYDHDAARKGKLVVLTVTLVSSDQFSYETEEGKKGTVSASFSPFDWLMINLDEATEEIRTYWSSVISPIKAKLASEEEKMCEAEARIKEAEAIDAL